MTYEPINSPDNTTLFPYHDPTPPTTRDVFRAHAVLRRRLPHTPLVRSEFLSDQLNAAVYIKREDTLPTGAFKVRGGLNLCHNLSDEFRKRGLITASTGNHGLSVAYAGREYDFPVTVVVPQDPSKNKIQNIKRLNAHILEYGDDYEEAREHAEKLAEAEGFRYVHSGNESDLIAGVGTAGIEVLADLPEVDTIVCPVGGGSSAAGYVLTVGKLVDADVIGVQAEAAPAVYEAWQTGNQKISVSADTFAEGMSLQQPFALPLRILQEGLTEFLTVSEEKIRQSIFDMLLRESVLVEGAPAAGIAGAFKMREKIEGNTVVIQISGRNLSPEKLADVLNEYRT